MWEFSRALYREVIRHVEPARRDVVSPAVLRAAETAIERVQDDPLAARRAARWVIGETRYLVPLCRQADTCRAVVLVCDAAASEAERRSPERLDAFGRPRRCPTLTRRGTQCRREPMPNGWCPSHQHLAEAPHEPPVVSPAAPA